MTQSQTTHRHTRSAMSAKIVTLISCQVCHIFTPPQYYVITTVNKSFVDDHFRVVLRAISVNGSDYINASFVDVRTTSVTHDRKLVVRKHLLSTHAGLQAAWSIHCYTGSNGEHC